MRSNASKLLVHVEMPLMCLHQYSLKSGRKLDLRKKLFTKELAISSTARELQKYLQVAITPILLTIRFKVHN